MFGEKTTQALKATHADSFTTLLEGILLGSIERRDLVVKMWEKSLKKAKRNSSKQASTRQQGLTNDSIIQWMDTYPILNEETHFATIMDARDGKVVWTKRYLEPYDCT